MPLLAAIALVVLQPRPDIDAIVRMAVQAERREAPLRGRYTYREQVIHKKRDPDGALVNIGSETYDCVFLEGGLYRKLVLVNGQPLAEEKQEEVDRAMAAERDRRRTSKGGTYTNRYAIGSIHSIPRLYEPRLLRDTIHEGRPVWLVEAAPRRRVSNLSAAEREALSFRHTFWIDKEENVIVRWRQEVVGRTTEFLPGSTIDWEYRKINHECWLQHRVTIFATVALSAQRTSRAITEQLFTDHRKFNVESTLTVPDNN